MGTEDNEVTEPVNPPHEPPHVNPETPHECEGCKSLRPLVESLTAKVESLAPIEGVVPTPDINPDTTPTTIPWTHRGGNH